MKQLNLIILILLCSSCIQKTAKEKTEANDVTHFFSQYLVGQQSTYDKEEALAFSELKEERDKVWKAWKEANQAFKEEKLIPLKELDQKEHSAWNLPSTLEPHAIMPYYWGSKGSFKPQDGYPLYLYLHGSGEKNREWATGLQLGLRFDDSPSAYFIPQIPNTGKYYRWWQKSKQFAWEKLLRLALISGEINPNRMYFFGISEGGYGSQRLASFYADYLAGAGPMAGGEPLINAPVENCRNLAFSLRTGAEDSEFCRKELTQIIKDEFDRFKAQDPAHFIHTVTLIPGKGHHIDYTPTTPWLKKQVRNPYPKFVSWENFEMDGRYRNGFYNLFIKERSNKDAQSRSYYEFSIKGNQLSLKVDEITYQTTEKDPKWGIGLKYKKIHTAAKKGKIFIYLCNELVDLSKEITLSVNGKDYFKGFVKLDRKNLVNSCAAFFDPTRLYPASIEVDLAPSQ